VITQLEVASHAALNAITATNQCAVMSIDATQPPASHDGAYRGALQGLTGDRTRADAKRPR
jgi:hypothetical protein